MIYFITLTIIYILWLFIRSKNNFFKQDRETLLSKRTHLNNVLTDFGVDTEIDRRWLDAYDNFKNYPKLFVYDGATIVNDLDTIKGYDAPAGNHDIAYYLLNWFSLSGFIEKFEIDYQYGLDMRKLDVPYLVAWSRVVLLWISTPFWYLWLIIKLIIKKK